MGRFFAKLFFALIPLFLYAAIFLIFETNNYWGFKPERMESPVYWSTPLATVRSFMRNPNENIILGDSRWYRMNLDYIKELCGDRYAILATGGQGVNLSREMYDFAQEVIPTKKIMLGVSFYQMNQNYTSASAQPVFHIAQHPFDYVITRDYVTDAFLRFSQYVKQVGRGYYSLSKFLRISEVNYNVDTPSDEIYLDYVNTIIIPNTRDYAVGEDHLNDVIFMATDVQSRGGKSLIVFPPVHKSIWDYVIIPDQLFDKMQIYHNAFSHISTVYDMEWQSDFSHKSLYFYDGFHFINNGGTDIVTKAIFTGKADFLLIKGTDEWCIDNNLDN